ncbi:hypothetical protein [Amycolatopsis methanolica]|uniref:SnoaL-like domain-containing protein n=1 Tax=Amycolatopsis methanolica 239 TaxID=1068978 RepID=A0A076MZ53_AMYME|nr:hypothetical protein [Amycolatopsis methanolica]AIJ24201.1 hypothetical protein AMETH_4109 [Amycolatopsis methanolica 239]
MTRRLPATFGPDSRNRLEAATTPGIEGALAALETFYFAFNQRDPDVFARVWTQEALAQLNNPLGGILRGGEAISALHDKLFHGPARVTVIVDGREVPLRTRTSRYFRYGTAAGRSSTTTAASTTRRSWLLTRRPAGLTDRQATAPAERGTHARERGAHPRDRGTHARDDGTHARERGTRVRWGSAPPAW